jgi:hypothetical protein
MNKDRLEANLQAIECEGRDLLEELASAKELCSEEGFRKLILESESEREKYQITLNLLTDQLEEHGLCFTGLGENVRVAKAETLPSEY